MKQFKAIETKVNRVFPLFGFVEYVFSEIISGKIIQQSRQILKHNFKTEKLKYLYRCYLLTFDSTFDQCK